MDMSLGELLDANPVYAQGEFYEPNLYKDLLPKHTFSAIKISESMREKGFRDAVLIEVASLVVSVALLIIPSILIYGPSYFAFTVGAGVFFGLISSTPVYERNRLSWLQALEAKGDIIAGLHKTGRFYQFIKKDLIIPTVFKIALYGLMRVPYKISRLAPFFITAVLSYKIGVFVENTLYGWVESLARSRRERELIEVS